MDTKEQNKWQHLSKCSNYPYNILAKNGHQFSQNETNTKETMHAPKTRVSVTIHIPHIRDNSFRIQMMFLG